MKEASVLKSKSATPKTPGGISKSLLTPCRRVGLSRNWRKSVASPFQSPLPSTESKTQNVDSRKRKETLEITPQKTDVDFEEPPENVSTPCRKVELPRRKKSKTLLNAIVKTADEDTSQSDPPKSLNEGNDDEIPSNDIVDISRAEVPNIVSTPVRLKSKSKSKLLKDSADLKPVSTPVQLKSRSKYRTVSPKSITSSPSTKSNIEVTATEKENIKNSNKTIAATTQVTERNIGTDNKNVRKTSPNNLTKECIVVIQKKIFKNQLQESKAKNLASQALFDDSDDDDVPLKCLDKYKTTEKMINTDDKDFDIKSKPIKTNSKTSKEKSTKPIKNIYKEPIKTVITAQIHNPPSQSSINDDDDDFVIKKSTILVRKSYDKVIKPHRAKSTGSITQKDIEDLKARIETKKKMLLAKSMTDTAELRGLIKKWQKGCQDALIELMDLMKRKCPDQSMEYSQILQSLKIPAPLVGYDSDNDCFVTPEDNNILLSHIKE